MREREGFPVSLEVASGESWGGAEGERRPPGSETETTTYTMRSRISFSFAFTFFITVSSPMAASGKKRKSERTRERKKKGASRAERPFRRRSEACSAGPPKASL